MSQFDKMRGYLTCKLELVAKNIVSEIKYLDFINGSDEIMVFTHDWIINYSSNCMIAEITATKDLIASCINGELILINGCNKVCNDTPEIESITFVDEEGNRYYAPKRCFSRFYHRSYTLTSGRVIELTGNEYEQIAEHIRREDAKEQFIDAIEQYAANNTEFANIEDFLKSHIDQAAERFYKKIRTSTNDYDMETVLNIFRGAFWCDITLKDGSKEEAVLMDSQIQAIENRQSQKLKTAKGDAFNSADVMSLVKDEVYTMD